MMLLRTFVIVCLAYISLNLPVGASELNAQDERATPSRGSLASSALIVGASSTNTPARMSAPATCQVGIYLLSLHNLMVSENTFTADFWLWIICPNTTLAPLDTMEFVNANSVEQTLGNNEEVADGVYRSTKIEGIFRHDWDLTDFPFDRHTLEILIEDTDLTAEEFVYSPDVADTGFHADSSTGSWKIADFDLTATPYTYTTTFGYPTISQDSASSDYSRLRLAVTLERHGYTGFFKLTAVVYIAFLFSLISFLIHVEERNELSSRLGLVGGALFAAAINMQVASSTLGNESRLSMVDNIHLVSLILILFAAILAIVSRIMLDMGRSSANVRRLNYRAMALSAILFIVSNVVLIISASHSI